MTSSSRWIARGVVIAIGLSASLVRAQQTAVTNAVVQVTIQKLRVAGGTATLINQLGDAQSGEMLLKGMIYAGIAPDCTTNPGVFRVDSDVDVVMARMLLGLSKPPSEVWALDVRLVSATAEEITITVVGRHKKFDATRALQDVGSGDIQRTLQLRPGQPQPFFGKADASAETACAFEGIQYQIRADFVADTTGRGAVQPPPR